MSTKHKKKKINYTKPQTWTYCLRSVPSSINSFQDKNDFNICGKT